MRCSADRYRKAKGRRVVVSEETSSPKSSSSLSRVPQSGGGFIPAGGGACLPTVLDLLPVKASGGQLAGRGVPPRLGGGVLAGGCERVADEALWRPVGEPDLASGPGDPEQLAGGLLLVGGEHHPDGGERHVEGCIGVRQVLRVPDLKGYLHALGFGAAASLFDQSGDVVQAGHVAGGAGGGARGVGGAGAGA